MDMIQVTNPKFHRQTLRSIIVANARHEIQLANQMRTLGYHRKTFLAKEERERKWLAGRLGEMTTSLEASRAREEEVRRKKERRRASLIERNEMNIDRSAADDNAVQMMKKLIEAAMSRPEPEPEPEQEVTAASASDHSRAGSPGGDGSVRVKSRASTGRRSSKLQSLQAIPPDELLWIVLSENFRFFQTILRGKWQFIQAIPPDKLLWIVL